jgi:hypothetical protein
MLHVTNGDSARVLMERSGIPGTFIAWPDVLHEGPTLLVSGDEWNELRSRYLASQGYGEPGASFEQVLHEYRERDQALESYTAHDEVVFWFEHDLFDELLLIRHLWWLGGKGAMGAYGVEGARRFSLVCGQEYLGMLRPEEFPALFDARKAITPAQIRLGTRAWEAFCDPDPMGLVPFAAPNRPAGDRPAAEPAEYADQADRAGLPYLPAAIRRHLEEFPSMTNGLARSERQILEVLSEGMRTPDETFIEASRLEDHIFMGDVSFWTIVRRLAESRRPLVAADVEPRPGRLPSGTLVMTADGAAVLSGRADHVALNGLNRWLGGAHLASGVSWRWTGETLVVAD